MYTCIMIKFGEAESGLRAFYDEQAQITMSMHQSAGNKFEGMGDADAGRIMYIIMRVAIEFNLWWITHAGSVLHLLLGPWY